jgi:hypothetical protein
VPPRDGDGFDGEEALVAEVIPLRRREREPREQATQERASTDELVTGGASPRSMDVPAPGDRSVWDQPTTDLRRRGLRTGATPPPASRGDAARTHVSRLSWGYLAVPVTVVVGAAVLALVLSGALRSTFGSAARLSASSTPPANSTTRGHAAITKRSPSLGARQPKGAAASRHRQEAHGRDLDRGHQSSAPGAQSTASNLAVADAAVGAAASPGSGSAAASSAAEFTPEARGSEVAAARPTPEPAANMPSTQESQCVPGELGC